MNELKTFLEEEHTNAIIYDNESTRSIDLQWLQDHDQRLVNFLLDLARDKIESSKEDVGRILEKLKI